MKIEITDLELKTTTKYNSKMSATRALKIRGTTISNYFLHNQIKPFKGRFIFKKL